MLTFSLIVATFHDQHPNHRPVQYLLQEILRSKKHKKEKVDNLTRNNSQRPWVHSLTFSFEFLIRLMQLENRRTLLRDGNDFFLCQHLR